MTITAMIVALLCPGQVFRSSRTGFERSPIGNCLTRRRGTLGPPVRRVCDQVVITSPHDVIAARGSLTIRFRWPQWSVAGFARLTNRRTAAVDAAARSLSL